MKRKIFIIRHAKAESYLSYVNDFDRPLAKRGKDDAPKMGKRLKTKGLIPEVIVSSTAIRAAQTAIEIAKQTLYFNDEIIWRNDLYHSSAEHIDEVISEVINQTNATTLFLIAHNPGITEYANFKVSNFKIDNIPTCGIFGYDIQLKRNETNNLDKKGTLIYYDFPKNINK